MDKIIEQEREPQILVRIQLDCLKEEKLSLTDLIGKYLQES